MLMMMLLMMSTVTHLLGRSDDDVPRVGGVAVEGADGVGAMVRFGSRGEEGGGFGGCVVGGGAGGGLDAGRSFGWSAVGVRVTSTAVDVCRAWKP
jgi:hypothetical protein